MTGRDMTALAVSKLRRPGLHRVSRNLYVQVVPSGARSWIVRYRSPAGVDRQMGIGALDIVSLGEARDAALEARKLLFAGLDPLEERARLKAEAAVVKRLNTFAEVADLYLEAHNDTWKNPKHRAQWRSTLDTYALPVLGNLSVASIQVGDVMNALQPIWRTVPETASRTRGRIESVIDFAIARGWRSAENPAKWRGLLSELLPARTKIAPTEHHPALPWREIGTMMQELAAEKGLAAQALRFTILTAARSGEVLGMTWAEIDTAQKLWSIPGARMKAKRDHDVPLSPAALAILETVRPLRNTTHGDYVFPGARLGRSLSNMAMTEVLRRMGHADIVPHGFRSTFRMWCAEATNYPRELAESALAHSVRDKVEAAYQRGSMIEKRRVMMEQWATFCTRPPVPAGVVLHLTAASA